jgi:hypothetical protein
VKGRSVGGLHVPKQVVKDMLSQAVREIDDDARNRALRTSWSTALIELLTSPGPSNNILDPATLPSNFSLLLFRQSAIFFRSAGASHKSARYG